MAYSETIGQTVTKVQTLIDKGARRSGKLAEELTSEQIVSARQSLFFLLSNLSNIGINYWAINKKVFGLKQDQYVYELPAGSIDALNVMYRKMNRPTPNSTGGYFASSGQVANAFDSSVETIDVQTAPNGNISINYGDYNSIYAGSIGILPGVSGSFHILLETSSDGVTWTTLRDTKITSWVDNEWLWYDIEPGVSAQWYRMRETSGNTLQVREFYVGNNSTEIPMARLNRDDYTSLPNKNFNANQPFQYWFNRTIPRPQITLWPVPSNPFIQMTVWYSRQVMDVGDLYGELEVPDRWLLAIQSMLAHQMSMELPGVPLDRIQYLQAQAAQYLNEAEQEERDKSPIYFAPNVSVYTR
jgi:hypothetical protein